MKKLVYVEVKNGKRFLNVLDTSAVAYGDDIVHEFYLIVTFKNYQGTMAGLDFSRFTWLWE